MDSNKVKLGFWSNPQQRSAAASNNSLAGNGTTDQQIGSKTLETSFILDGSSSGSQLGIHQVETVVNSTSQLGFVGFLGVLGQVKSTVL